MPAPKQLKPTIYFRGGYWRVREPTPRPYNSPEAQRWIKAHDFLAWLNYQPFAIACRARRIASGKS